jgi:hypothetical protein
VTKTSETNKQEQGEEDTGSWRKVMPKKVTANSETMESKAPKKSANIYVPPPMREKEREK